MFTYLLYTGWRQTRSDEAEMRWSGSLVTCTSVLTICSHLKRRAFKDLWTLLLYLIIFSIHIIVKYPRFPIVVFTWLGFMIERKEGNVLYNGVLNTFYLRLYGVRHRPMVKVHANSEWGNPLLPHGLLFPIISKGSFICMTPQTGHTTAFVILVMVQWLER